MQSPNDQQPWQTGQPQPGSMPPSGSVPPGSFPPPQARVRFDVLGEAWALLQQQMGMWIVATLIYFVIVGGVSAGIVNITGGAQRTAIDPSNPMGAFGPSFFIQQLISLVVQSAIGGLLIGGMFRMAIRQIRGEAVGLGDIFSATDVFPALFIGSLLMTLIMWVGLVLCIIPGLIFGGLMMFMYPLIVDKGLSGPEAISLSWNTLKSQMFPAMAFMILIGLVVIAGACLCGVGLLFTFPLYVLSVTALYRDFFMPATGAGGSMPGTGPVSPIPEPGSMGPGPTRNF